MTLFCGLTKRFSFGLAVLACGQSAMAGGPFKPASYGQMNENSSANVGAADLSAQPYMMQTDPGMYGYPGDQMPMGGMPMMGMPMGGMPMGGMPMGGMPMGGMPMGGMPMGGISPAAYESYPGQYSEPSTQGSYVSGMSCDSDGMGSCGPGCGHGILGGGDGEGLACGYCGTPGCGLGGRCLGQGRSLSYMVNNALGRGASLLPRLLPYGEGGVATQRWYDVSVETIALRRSKDARDFALTSSNVGGPTVLSTNDVDLDSLRAGLGVQINVQAGVGSNIEVAYFGLNRWRESASVTGPANLFSYISDFGNLPAGGFDDTDRSLSQSVDYISAIHNGEVNFRRRWVEPSGFFQGSFLSGIRYFDLDEELLYSTRGENNNGTNNGLRFADFSTQTRNQLVGFQLGGDLWYNVMPGVKIGTELKSGIYNNQVEQATLITSNSIDTLGVSTQNFFVNETADNDRTAFLTQFSVSGWYRLSYSLALRSSFQMIYVDNVALAPENINPVPLSLATQRQAAVRINDDGEVLYTGFTFGGEYSW